MIDSITTLLTSQVGVISTSVVAVLTAVLPVAIGMLLFYSVGEKSRVLFTSTFRF